MAKLLTTKIDAARRQLDAAIRLFFALEDPFAVHTIISAAHRILRDLAEQSGRSRFHQTVKGLIRPGMEGEFWSAINKNVNFLKHANSDPEATLEFEEEVNDALIAHSCLYYETLGHQLTPDMRGFIWWYMMMKPNLLVKSSEIRELLLRPEFHRIRELPRNEQLSYGGQLCSMIKKQRLKN
jgi:hypothetical protein